MTLDNQSLFSDGQALTNTLSGSATSVSTVSESTLDWKNHGDDVGHYLAWFVMLTEGAGAGTSTLNAALQTSADNSSWETVSSKTVTAPAAGAFVVDGDALPSGLKRYVRVNYTIGTAEFTTAPKVTAGLVREGTNKKRQG